ncbi:hypothetical protein B0H14DRAFT_865284 [Mycena olivaceomarginata]|nr:hypothetical protein B0H14DRAFT_865284 [Mycena olivaceomarginata]
MGLIRSETGLAPEAPISQQCTAGFLECTTMNAVSQSPTESLSPDTDHDELAAAKLWALYISEAEKYDKTLVEGWKSDMEGLLIFAGLFSASLTAFLIESYKTLSQDQGAMTIALLAQISRQLDPRLNASAAEAMASTRFIPSASSLACNTLWFLSLGLSLSCALIAILVEQWSRDFIQRTEMHPSPIIRARIFSYLYFGMQRFGMHTIVEFIPLLLHGSLLLFFAGLVAFLYPINPFIMLVAAALLGLVLATYTYLTVLPIFFSDSPYRTPLSNMAWNLLQWMRDLFSLGRRHWPDEESTTLQARQHIVEKHVHPTMVQVMKRDAAQESHERDERDARAIGWTVRSLTDNDHIEPLVEALPELVLGSDGRANLRAYHDMLTMLLDDPAIRLIPRIEDLLRTCNSGFLPPDILTRRRMSCIKALWAIAYFVGSDASKRSSLPVFDIGLLWMSQENSPVIRSSPELANLTPWGMNSSPEFSNLTPWGIGGSQYVITATPTEKLSWTAAATRERTYLTSAYSIVRWINFSALLSFIQDVDDQLNTTAVPDAAALLKDLYLRANNLGFPNYAKFLAESIHVGPILAPLPILRKSREILISSENVNIFTEYLSYCANLHQKPRAFETICSMIRHPELLTTEPSVQRSLKDTFIAIIQRHKHLLPPHSGVHHIDVIAETILRLVIESPVADNQFNHAVTAYVASRAGSLALDRCEPSKLGFLLTQSLSSASTETQTGEMIWSLYVLAMNTSSPRIFSEKTLIAMSAAPQCPISPCARAVIKTRILQESKSLPPNELDMVMDRLKFPAETRVPFEVTERWKAAFFAILVELVEEHLLPSSLDGWNTTVIVNTVNFIGGQCPRIACREHCNSAASPPGSFRWLNLRQTGRGRSSVRLSSGLTGLLPHSSTSPLHVINFLKHWLTMRERRHGANPGHCTAPAVFVLDALLLAVLKLIKPTPQ